MRRDQSRTSARKGTKSLVCGRCGTGEKGKVRLSFRGRTYKRLALHLAEVHADNHVQLVLERRARRGY